jgi:hypothetical protein
VWLLLGMAAGMHVGLSGEFGQASHHAHMGLLGGLWAVAFAWLFDRRGAPLTTAARLQWALYNLGVATMAVAMFLVVRQGGIWGMIIGIGGIVVITTTSWMVVDAWPRRQSA